MAKAVHRRDMRLHNNAGMNFPVCRVSDKPIDTALCAWPTTADPSKVTCKACLKMHTELYPHTAIQTKAEAGK